jgi:alkylation response protein AidB-like acyl-CoA dehydrogenase
MNGVQAGGREQFGAVAEGVGRVAAAVARRAEEIDKLASFPPELYDDLVATGFFRALRPAAYGVMPSRWPRRMNSLSRAPEPTGLLGG